MSSRLLFVAFTIAFAAPALAQTELPAIHRALRDTINVGADLFNLQADYAGCYRLYQGCLLSIKPLLDTEMQKEIDTALAEAAKQPSAAEQAFALRTTIDSIRDRIRPPEVISVPPTKVAVR